MTSMCLICTNKQRLAFLHVCIHWWGARANRRVNGGDQSEESHLRVEGGGFHCIYSWGWHFERMNAIESSCFFKRKSTCVGVRAAHLLITHMWSDPCVCVCVFLRFPNSLLLCMSVTEEAQKEILKTSRATTHKSLTYYFRCCQGYKRLGVFLWEHGYWLSAFVVLGNSWRCWLQAGVDARRWLTFILSFSASSNSTHQVCQSSTIITPPPWHSDTCCHYC